MMAMVTTARQAMRRTGLAAAILAALGPTQLRAASCSDLDVQLETKANALAADLESGAVGGMCNALNRHVALLEEMISFHEQCGAEMDPTGQQLAEYRKIMPETVAARDQLCGG